MKILIPIIILFLIYSCESLGKKESNITKISIDVKEDTPAVLFSDIFTSYRLVQLETTEESLIGSIGNLILTLDKLVIGDSKTQQILAFDKETGRFLHKIGSIGGAPYEFSYPEGIAYNKFNDFILVKDGYRKIVVYKSDGTFVKNIPIKPMIKNFCCMGNDRIVLQMRRGEGEEQDINIIDYDGNLISKGLQNNIPKSVSSYGYSHFSNFDDRTILHCCSYYNYVYAVSEKSVYPKYEIDYGKYNAPKDIYNYKEGEKFQKLADIENENIAFTVNFFETENLIITQYKIHEGYNVYTSLMDKKTSKVIEGQIFIDDLKGIVYANNIGFLPSVVDNKYISYINPIEFIFYGKENIDRLKAEKKEINIDNIFALRMNGFNESKNVKACLQRAKKKTIDETDLQFLYSITEESNPIIMIADLKQDISF